MTVAVKAVSSFTVKYRPASVSVIPLPVGGGAEGPCNVIRSGSPAPWLFS